MEAADHPAGRDPVTTGLFEEETGGTMEGLVKRLKAPGPPHSVLMSPEHPMLHWEEGVSNEAPLSSVLPQKHSDPYSVPACLNPRSPQYDAHLAGVMSLAEVAAPVNPRPFLGSAMQAVDAADHPDGREADLAVRSEESEVTLDGMTKMVKASDPPQILVGEPEQAMVH